MTPYLVAAVIVAAAFVAVAHVQSRVMRSMNSVMRAQHEAISFLLKQQHAMMSSASTFAQVANLKHRLLEETLGELSRHDPEAAENLLRQGNTLLELIRQGDDEDD
jgi:archaellum component FlaF (FlaF/FlaG flagellin family)